MFKILIVPSPEAPQPIRLKDEQLKSALIWSGFFRRDVIEISLPDEHWQDVLLVAKSLIQFDLKGLEDEAVQEDVDTGKRSVSAGQLRHAQDRASDQAD